MLRLIEGGFSSGSFDLIKKRIKESHWKIFSLEEPLEDKPSENKSRHKKQRVPSERNRSNGQKLRIHAPVNK